MRLVDRCDVIIPVWNETEVTRACVDSLIKNTSYPYRLIILDNASGPETKRYLESLKEKRSLDTLIIRNEQNLGFITAANQGIDSSDAKYVCILNNDTLVTDGWLREMVHISDSRKDIGIVNPSSNNLGQKAASGESIESFAEKLKKESGRFVELGSAVGFCMLIKKEVIGKIGLFDEVYGMGNFEDTDFSRKAVKEGYICVRACGAYVHHKENTSFNKIKEFDDDFKRNREIFESRWGKPRRIACILTTANPELLKKLNTEAIKQARLGNWVRYYSKDKIEVPEHSNISLEGGCKINFVLYTVLKIITKKKKFDEILLGEDSLGRIFKMLRFIHRASINYY